MFEYDLVIFFRCSYIVFVIILLFMIAINIIIVLCFYFVMTSSFEALPILLVNFKSRCNGFRFVACRRSGGINSYHYNAGPVGFAFSDQCPPTISPA